MLMKARGLRPRRKRHSTKVIFRSSARGLLSAQSRMAFCRTRPASAGTAGAKEPLAVKAANALSSVRARPGSTLERALGDRQSRDLGSRAVERPLVSAGLHRYRIQ